VLRQSVRPARTFAPRTFFAKLKQFRAIATRYDKRGQNFLAAIYRAAAVIWLN
jgi:transposase